MIALQYFGLMLVQLIWFGACFALGYYGSRLIRRKRQEYLAKKARP